MADENKPAFYPRVGRTIAKNFRSAQPPAFIEDPRAMELPQYSEFIPKLGTVDLSVPTKENRELNRRITQRDADLMRQVQADRSPLEKLAGGIQAGRFMGSALTQAVNSLPTRIFKGDEAADKFIQDRIYKPEQPLAYEYAQDIGDFLEKLETEYKIPPVLPEAMALQFLTGPATSQAMRTAGRGAEQVGRKIESAMEPVVKGAFERGGLPREMVLAMGANTQSNVIKPKGGNWIGGDVEKALDPLITKGVISNREIPYGPEFDTAIVQRIADLKETASMPGYKGGAGRVAKMLEEDLQDAVSTQNRVKNAAINKWVQSNLTNYVKKDMGTPEDPVRKLAEQDISHLPQDLQNIEMTWTPEELAKTRKRFGFPEEETATNPTAKMWEQMADEMIAPSRATEFGEKARQQNPWLDKLNPYDTVYETMRGMPQALKFDHIVDVLREDIASGRIRPEQLNKVSMEQAVRRTYEYDQELAKKMAEARTTSRAELPVYKDYPEGFKWIQLTRPGDFAAESDAMGHSVRGYEPPKGHPDYVEGSGDSGSSSYGLGGWEAIKSGEAKVYSLVDAKGEPHTTIEVGKGKHPIGFTGDGSNFPYGLTYGDSNNNYLEIPLEKQQEIYELGKKLYFENPNAYAENRILTGAQAPNLMDTFQKAADMLLGEKPGYVRQIKGKGNARPISKYDPYTQDFVKSGGWSEVRDLQNTGLINVDGRYFTEPELTEAAKKYGRMGVMDTTWDVARQRHIDAGISEEDALRNWVEGFKEGRGRLDIPPEGMKRGGKVSISNNPDTMMMELGNKRMKEGGSEDDTKPYFGGAGTKKYAPAKKRAEDADVNLLKDPRTYATVAGFMGERPDEMGFSVLHPDYQGVREAADPAFYAGTALGIAPLGKALNAPFAAIGKALDPAVGRFVTKTMERGGLGADILTDMVRGTRSYAYLPHTEKSPNPLVGTRYKTQHVGNLAPKFDFDVQAEQGSSVMSNPWDLTSRGEKVLEVSDIPMSNQMITEGGHDFARDIANIKATIGGASGRQIAERMQDRVNDATFANLFDKGTGRVFTMPSTMDVKGSHFSTMPTDLVMDIFQQRGLKPKDVERITDDLRTFVFETEKGKFRNAAPVGSPEFLLQLRQGGKGFSAGDLRKGLMDRMSKSEYQKMLGYNIEDVYGAIGDQSLKGLPKGFVGNTMIETSPFAGLKPATHQSYDTANMGKYAGSMPSMPLELMMPDLFRAIEINYLKDPRYRKLTPLQLRTMIVNTIEKRGNVISQPINQRVVDNVMRYKQGLAQGHFKPNDYDSIMEFMRRTGGYKDGGAVHKAEGGEVSGDDLILEERPL